MKLFKLDNVYYYIHKNFKNLVKSWNNDTNTIREKESELYNRMSKMIQKQNGQRSHYYKPHIISIKSKQISSYINTISNFDEKLILLKNIQKIFLEVSKHLYRRFDPHMIYTFSNQIHLVFYYNDYGNFLYNGNIKRILTSLVSYTSILVANEFTKNNIDLDFCFEGTLVEIDKEYEALNYIIWTQYDCKRNTLTLLYRCLSEEKSLLNFIKLDYMEKEINNITPIDYTLVNGLVLKKKIYNKEIDGNKFDKLIKNEYDDIDETIRRNLEIDIVWFPNDFKENLDKYIIKKYL